MAPAYMKAELHSELVIVFGELASGNIAKPDQTADKQVAMNSPSASFFRLRRGRRSGAASIGASRSEVWVTTTETRGVRMIGSGTGAGMSESEWLIGLRR